VECTRTDPSQCYQCQMAKLANGLMSGDYSQEEMKAEFEQKSDDAKPADDSGMNIDSEETAKKQKVRRNFGFLAFFFFFVSYPDIPSTHTHTYTYTHTHTHTQTYIQTHT